jgi:hypothetical protein
MTLIMILMASLAFATIRNVGPGQTYSTIQAAVNASSTNDVIRVFNSVTPYSLFSFEGKTIEVSAASNNNPIIDASAYNYAVKADSTTDAELIGFTIMGTGTLGVSCIDTDNFTISNCEIKNFDTGVLVQDCIDFDFESNEIYNTDIGIYFSNTDIYSDNASLNSNDIHDNIDGVQISSSVNVTNTISMSGMLIYSNSDNGIYFSGTSMTSIGLHYSTITDNDTGIEFHNSSVVAITNSIVHGNDTNTFSGTADSLNITYSCIEGGSAGTGNVGADPEFCTVSPWEYYLLEGSPCIDGGDPTMIDYPDSTRLDIGRYTTSARDYKPLTGSLGRTHWNWISYPRLFREDNDPDDAPELLDDMLPMPEGDMSMLYESDSTPELTYDAYPTPTWDPDTYDIYSDRGYKLSIVEADTYIVPEPGTRLAANHEMSLSVSDEWVGYWLPQTQTYTAALGDQLDDLKSVRGEDWYIYKRGGQWYGDTSLTANEGTFEYGKAYVLGVTTAFDLVWESPGRGVTPKFSEPEPEIYTIEELPNYQMIVIEEIEDAENALEVAVFQNGECLGAEVIEDFPITLQAYTDEYNRSDELTFEVSYGRGNSMMQTEMYNFETRRYEPAVMHPWQHEFSLIKLAKGDYTVPTPVKPYLNNHPNPFNPSTTISYNVAQTSSFVSLKIYNVKGQLVKTLVNGKQEQGAYSVTWNGKDESDNAVSSGIYYSRIETAGKTITKKMVLMK